MLRAVAAHLNQALMLRVWFMCDKMLSVLFHCLISGRYRKSGRRQKRKGGKQTPSLPATTQLVTVTTLPRVEISAPHNKCTAPMCTAFKGSIGTQL